VYHQYYWGQTR